MYKLNLKSNISICLIFSLYITMVYSQNCDSAEYQQCQNCKGYYWYANSCHQCSFATTEQRCELCLGFYFKDTTCQSCNDITNPALCQQCTGYFFSSQKCQSCDLAPAYLCILECPNYYLRSGICTHCGQARDQLTCKNCVASFQFKENKCVQCPKHYINNDIEYQCMSCQGLNEAYLCSKCPQFYFQNSSCHSCKTSTNAKSCMLCSGFYFNGTNCNHCNEATQSSCMNCPNHIFINGFCTPCRLISDSNMCQSCPLFRYSSDRKMCVPCQQRGFYLQSNNTCVHCSRSRTRATCNNCPGYIFDTLYNVCSNCSEIISEQKCKQCPSYFYSVSTYKCTSCKDADLLQCLIYCDNFFFKNKCVSCQQATSLAECRRCGYNYYWSSSRQCLPCKATDYYRKNNQCVPCSTAKNAEQCSFCPYHYYSNLTCRPCKTATDELECKRCKSLNFFYNNATAKCDYCQIASQTRCIQSNCPGFAYYNGSCRAANSILTQSQCEKYPHFTFQSQMCNFCIKKSQYLDPFTKMCYKCQSFRNSSACTKCPHFYFDKTASSCKICIEANRQQCKSCYGYTFTNGSCKYCQYLKEKKSCDTCLDYFFIDKNCSKCEQAVANDDCMKCKNFGWEKKQCKRCEKITDMVSCEKSCKAYGYYAFFAKNLCLNCLHTSNKTTCDLCPNYYWSETKERCLSCSQTNQSCALCGGFMKLGYCQPCLIQNCKLCSTQGLSCLQCQSSYISQSQGTFCRKNCSAPYCTRCDDKSSTFCIQCRPDFLFSPLQGKCSLKCNVLNCLSCSSNSVCRQCSIGYISTNDGRSCECNKQNCLTCAYKNNQTTCTSCKQGYQINSALNICVKVKCYIDKCENCLSSQTCLKCENGYKYNDNKAICTPICSIEGCSLCQTAISCHRCSNNYKLINDLTCQPNCKIQNCERCASQTTCKKCIGRYTKSIDQTRCQRKCQFLGLFNLNNTCQTCQNIYPNCHTCIQKNQATVCTKCLPTYGLDVNSCTHCASSMPFCIGCRNNNSVGFSCTQCQSGYSLVDRLCKKCSENCLRCVRRGEMNCDTCIEGYVYVIQSINSHKCKPCLNNCRTCKAEDIRQCWTCFQGYFINGTNCIKCSSNCLKCTDEKTCLQCSHSSVTTPNGCTELSIPNCIEGSYIKQSIICIDCKVGYEQKNGKCIESNCTRSKNCKQCKIGNYLKNGECFTCPKIQGCQTCQPSDPTVCKTCNLGYYLNLNQQCIPCVEGCSVCISSSTCNIAAESYFIEQSIKYPFKCSKNCLICKGAFLCSNCSKGFIQYKNQCIRDDSLIFNITIEPIKAKDSKSAFDQRGISMSSWYNYYIQIFKLIALNNIEEEFFLDSIDIQKGKFGFIIDLSIEIDKAKIIKQINNNINKRSQLFRILTLNISSLNGSQKVQKQESSSINKQISGQSQTSKPSNSQIEISNSSAKSKPQSMSVILTWAIVVSVMFVFATIVIVILMRRRSRVINKNNPEHPYQLDKESTNPLQGMNYRPAFIQTKSTDCLKDLRRHFDEKNEKQNEGKSQSIEFKSEQILREQAQYV